MKSQLGDEVTIKILTVLIVDAVLFFNVGKTMNPEQVKDTSEMILDEFVEITPADLKLCFNKAKKGEYGHVFDRIDGQVILNWIRQYCDDKISYFINKNERAHNNQKLHEGMVSTIDRERDAKKNRDISAASQIHAAKERIERETKVNNAKK